MADLKSTGELTRCPVCEGRLFDISDAKSRTPEMGCEKCKRIWIPSDGQWVSRARLVRVVREPRAGDSPDDFLEEIKQ